MSNYSSLGINALYALYIKDFMMYERDDKLISTDEVIDILRISKSTLYRVLNNLDDIDSMEGWDGFPRPFKFGKTYKWNESDIMGWLETRRVK